MEAVIARRPGDFENGAGWTTLRPDHIAHAGADYKHGADRFADLIDPRPSRCGLPALGADSTHAHVADANGLEPQTSNQTKATHDLNRS
jgi:hypothetical protein